MATGEKDVFEKVWHRQHGLCLITGEYIRFENVCAWNFPHVLAKGQNKYPQFKLLETNIVMTNKRFHDLYDNGTKERIYTEFHQFKYNLDKFYKLREALLFQYDYLYSQQDLFDFMV